MNINNENHLFYLLHIYEEAHENEKEMIEDTVMQLLAIYYSSRDLQ